jgi:hypothetical protein
VRVVSDCIILIKSTGGTTGWLGRGGDPADDFKVQRFKGSRGSGFVERLNLYPVNHWSVSLN